jgi:putative ABC transport system permease protein
MTNLLNDARYALRQLRNTPGFTLTAVLTLALGIGSTTAIFSVIDGVLLRPLPFPHADQLMALGDHLQGLNVPGHDTLVTATDIPAYVRDTTAFSSLGGYQLSGYELSGSVEPVDISGARLGAGMFPTLGVAPLMGRTFTQQEDEHADPVAVLSYATWKSRFHGDPNVLGKTILLDRKPYAVIGVMPRNFEFPLQPGQLNRSELWVPLSLTHSELAQPTGWNFNIVGRMKPGVTIAQAQTDSNRVAREIMRNYPAYLASLHIDAIVQALQSVTVADARPLLRVLFLAVFVVLLIACANLAGLLLVRAIRRRRETAVRLALGSTAGTLVRQALLESLVLSVSGGLLGVALAAVAIRISVGVLPETLPRIDDIHMNWAVVAFAVLLAVATGILCGLAPAFAALRTNMNEGLKEGGRTGSAGGGHARFRSILVVSEIAVALVLLIASGLLLRSFQKMRDIDLGFHPGNVLIALYNLPPKQYSTQASINSFNRELLGRLRQLPGAQTVGLASNIPMAGTNSNSGFVADGYVQPKGVLVNLADSSAIAGDYFHAIGIPLVRGRSFTEADNAQAPLAAVVNRKLAEHFWPNQDPIGKRIRIGDEKLKTPWMTIVGEIGNAKTTAPDGDTSEQVYQPVGQMKASFGELGGMVDLNGNQMFVAMRTAMPPELMENSLRAVFHSLDPQLAVTQVQSMEHAVSDTEAPRRFNTTIISAFGIIAVLLAILGIYSVIAFTVALRTQEMAIRMALGASRGTVRRLVLLSGAKLAVVGCAVGLAGAVAGSHLVQSLLFEVDPFDPIVLVSAAVAILLLAVAASALPAQRAATVDPMRALREQ